jgi:hypothetical protein
MNPAAPSKRVVMSAGVVPTVVALVVAAIMIIERLQVDWTASCALVANVAQPCGLQFYEQLFSLLLPSFAFAVAHIIGAAGLYSGGGTSRVRGERAAKLAVFTAIHVFPAFGWYLFYVGVAAGFLISITIIGLVVAPLVGAMAAGFVSGTLLALAAGPSPRTLDSNGWKRLVWFYGWASALGPIVLFGGPLLALGLLTPVVITCLAAVAVSSSLVWVAALQASQPSLKILQQPTVRAGLTLVAAAAIVLVLPVHLMVSSGLKVLPPDEGFFAPLSSFVRGHKPPIATTLELAGMRYLGPRAAILERGLTSREYQLTTKMFEGTPRETNYSETRREPLHEWLIRDPDPRNEEKIHVIAASGGEPYELYCLRTLPDRDHCTVSPDRPVQPDTSKAIRYVAYKEGDRYEFLDGLKHASLYIRWDLRKGRAPNSGEPFPRLFCRLNLVSVTKAAFSVHQVIRCDADWPAEAKRIRGYVESLFAAGAEN